MTEEDQTGHNNPPFDPAEIVNLPRLPAQLRDTYKHLFEEAAKYGTSFAKWQEAHPAGIVDDDDQAKATEFLAQLKGVQDAYHGKPTSAHTLAKKPFLEGGRIVDEVMNAQLTAPIRTAIEKLSAPVLAYANAKRRREQEEAAAKAKAAAEEAAKAAALAAAGPMSDDEALERALRAEQEAADVAAIAAESVKSRGSTRGDLGGLSGVRVTWHARVRDVNKLPREYMVPDMKMIEAKMNSSKDKRTGKPSAEIPGVEFYEETGLSVRR